MLAFVRLALVAFEIFGHGFYMRYQISNTKFHLTNYHLPRGRTDKCHYNKFTKHHSHGLTHLYATLRTSGNCFDSIKAPPNPISENSRRNQFSNNSSPLLFGRTRRGPKLHLYSSDAKAVEEDELNVENVEAVLEELRPYLKADGGDCKVVKVEGGVVFLQLQGACGTCPSSVVTVKMGIETRLKEKFPHMSHVETVTTDEETGRVDMLNEEGVERVLDGIRSFLSVMGGGIKLVNLTVPKEGIASSLTLKFTGNISTGLSGSIRNEILMRIRKKFPVLADIIIN